MLPMNSRLLFAVTLVLLSPVLGVLHPQLAGATEIALDQSQTAQNSSGMIGGGGWTGEVFTAGQSGYLARVSLYLAQYAPSPATGRVLVSVQTVTSDGLPSGAQIGFGSIPVDNIPALGGWVDISIGTFVTAGTKYALIPSAMNGIFLWSIDNGDVKPYPSGYWVNNTAGVWQKILTNQDWTFKTYVAPDTLDQNQSQVSGTGGGTRSLGTTPVGQTFTVGRYGLLDRVSVYLTNSSANPGPISVTILKVTSNGLPAIGSEVARGTIPADAIPKPTYRGWTRAEITHFVVTPNTKYALLLATSVSGPQWILVNDVYAGGAQVIKNGTSWTVTSYDFAFQTYALEPILDQSQTASSASTMVCGGQQQGQIFTAGLTGILSRVGVKLDKSIWVPATEPVAVSIQLVTDGLPAGILGTGAIPLSWIAIPGNPGWVDDVSISGAFVTAGRQYALVLDENSEGCINSQYHIGDNYSGGYAAIGLSGHWLIEPNDDLAFKTWVLPASLTTTGSGPGGGSIMPCSNGVCPAASGGFTPADLTDGVTSHFQFQVRPNGTIQGILNFSDPRPDGIVLRGCTTESAACMLAVTALVCTDAHSITIGGTYTPRGSTAINYRLTLSGVSGEPGTFKLIAGEYSFTLTLDDIANVTCPPKPNP